MNPYVYIVVRTDIRREYQLVQACHSALEAGYEFSKPELTTHLVVLSANDEKELIEISGLLASQGVRHKGFTESWGNMGLTSIATEPIEKQTEGVLRNLSLLCYGDSS